MTDRVRDPERDRPYRSDAEDSSISLLTILTVLLRRRRIVIGVALALSLLTLVISLVGARHYTVASSFIVQSNDQGAAASIASKLGMDVPGSDPSQTPAFYAALVKTPVILERLADAKFATRDVPTRRRLADIWEADGDEPTRRATVLTMLDQSIVSNLAVKLDLVSIAVSTRDPVLSRELSDTILAEITRFNLDTRQSRAGKERRFTEERMAEVRGELRVAEDRLQRFLEANRQQFRSAEIELERERLARQASLLTATYTQLATSFERARIDEVRDTPVITVIQQPKTPLLPDRRGLANKFILMLGLGLVLGVVIAFVTDVFSGLRRSPDLEAREFQRLLSEVSIDPRRIGRGSANTIERPTGRQLS